MSAVTFNLFYFPCHVTQTFQTAGGVCSFDAFYTGMLVSGQFVMPMFSFLPLNFQCATFSVQSKADVAHGALFHSIKWSVVKRDNWLMLFGLPWKLQTNKKTNQEDHTCERNRVGGHKCWHCLCTSWHNTGLFSWCFSFVVQIVNCDRMIVDSSKTESVGLLHKMFYEKINDNVPHNFTCWHFQ